jgi:folylpolyglutamate synthase/dihydropteroate synthase
MEFLGDTIEAIALEKIEIARKEKPFLVPRSIAEIASVQHRLQAIGCRPHMFEEKHGFQNNETILNELFTILELENIGREMCMLPGRREFWPLGRGVYVDGAHNPAAWRELVKWIDEHVEERPLIVLACSKNRNVEQMLEILEPAASEVRVLDASHERLRAASEWPDRVDILRALDAGLWKKKPVVITGSLYLIEFFYAWLSKNEPRLFESKYYRVFSQEPIQPRPDNGQARFWS